MNDDLDKANGFISQYDGGDEHPAGIIPQNQVWGGIDDYRKAFADGMAKGKPIWGNERLTWIKLRIPD